MPINEMKKETAPHKMGAENKYAPVNNVEAGDASLMDVAKIRMIAQMDADSTAARAALR